MERVRAEIKPGSAQWIPFLSPGCPTHWLTEDPLVITIRRQRKKLKFIHLRETEGWLESIKRSCSFPFTDVGDGLYFRSTVKLDFHLQRPSQEGMWFRHMDARDFNGNLFGLPLESKFSSSPLPLGWGGWGQWGITSL